MKTVLTSLAVILLLFLELAQVGLLGELKKHQDQIRAPGGETREMDQLRGYLDLVGRYSVAAKDPSQSGVAAVLYAHEVNKAAPPEQAIAFYTNLLPDVKDDAVRRAIRFELVELYAHGSHPDVDKATEQLRLLMTSPPPASADRPATAQSPTIP